MQKSKGQEPKADAISQLDKAVQDKLESLKGDYKELETKKIQTETNIQTLEDELKRLRAQAQKTYGTSDLEELKNLLEKRRQENEQLVAGYEQHIQGIKERLAEIESAPESETP
jgi:peptidoglycan hydrolase CwlO-like protein